MAVGGFSEQELAGLSPEERAALQGDDDDKAALKSVIDDTKDADGQDDGEGDAEGADDEGDGQDDDAGGADQDDEEAQGDKAAKADAAQPTQGAADDDDEEPFVPRFKAEPVADYDEQVKALATQRTEVLAKFKAGDLDPDAMDAQLEEIESKRRDLEWRKNKAELAQEQEAQASTQQWEWEVKRFLRTAAAEGVDYRVDRAQAALEAARKGSDQAAIDVAERSLRSVRRLNAALDAEVKALAQDPRYADKSGEWFLNEAHRAIKEQFNLGVRPAAQNREDATRRAIRGRKPDLRSVPKTLGDLPAAGSDDASTGDDEFSHLDKLSGMELEAEVARMSKADQERWLRAQA